jgi:hypothetical protein
MERYMYNTHTCMCVVIVARETGRKEERGRERDNRKEKRGEKNG